MGLRPLPMPSAVYTRQTSREEPSKCKSHHVTPSKHPPMASSLLTQGPAWMAPCNLPHDLPDLSSCLSYGHRPPWSFWPPLSSLRPLLLRSQCLHTPLPGVHTAPSLQCYVFIQMQPLRSIKVLAGLVPGESSLPGLQCTLAHHALTSNPSLFLFY